jgi:uncharacterized protein DUF5753/helix-turn-helix protein
MDDRQPTVRSRELGEGLRAAMKSAGMGVRDLGRRLDWPHPRVSHLLSGKRGGSELDVVSVLVACNVRREERERLMGLCRELGTQGWLQQYGSQLPEQLRTYVDHENKATDIWGLQLAIIPGLLQTEDYARAVIRKSVHAPAQEVEGRVQARLTRQGIFNRYPPPRITYYIHETVLRVVVGSATVMSDQLHHLLRMAVRPRLEIRIIPCAAGAHAGMAGPFMLMEFPSITPLVYLEGDLSAVFLEQQDQIDGYRRILSALATTALGQQESRDLIAALATELYREDQDDRANLEDKQL